MRGFLCVLLLFFAACGSSSSAGGSGAAALGITPNPGQWQGADMSFRLVNGQVTDLTLAPLTCTGPGGCQGSLSGPLDGSWPYGVLFDATPAAGQVVGNFIANTSVAGSLQLQAGTCCQISVTWSADWVGDLTDTSSGDDSTSGADGSATDASGNDVDGGSLKDTDAGGGKDVDGGGTKDTGGGSKDTGGSTDAGSSGPWDGASFGTIHPGPAQNAASPAPLSCLTSDQQNAEVLLNQYRNAVGAPVVNSDCSLAKASKAHADFYVTHVSQYNASGLSVHEEDQSYGAGFTGVNFWDRDTAAGFSGGQTSGEVIAFETTPAAALQGWIDTVYHRLPLLSPTTQLIGYGQQISGGTAINVIDSSGRNGLKSDPIIVWPWPGQHNVAASWNGLEGPTPPAPPSGFPSGPVVTAQFWTAMTVTSHQLTDAGGNAIAHTWLDQKSDPNLANLAPETVGLYANKPLANGTYAVSLTLSTGDVLAWRFTVGN